MKDAECYNFSNYKAYIIKKWNCLFVYQLTNNNTDLITTYFESIIYDYFSSNKKLDECLLQLQEYF